MTGGSGARLRLLLAGTAPLALAAGGAAAALTGEPLGWAALAVGLVSGLALIEERRRPSAASAAGARDVEDRVLVGLMDQLPVTVWLEDWTPIRAMLDTARTEAGGDLAGWLDRHPEQRRHAAAAVKVLHANPAAMQLYRASGAADLHDPDFDVMLTRESGERVASILGPLLDGATSAIFDSIDQRASDGSRVSVRTALVVARGHETDWSRIVLVESDITREVEVNRRLAASERTMRELLEQLPMAVWLEDWSSVRPLVEIALSESGGDLTAWLEAHPEALERAEDEMRVIYVNRAAVELYRASSPDQLQDREFATLMSVERAELIATQIRNLLGGARRSVFDATDVPRADGSLMSMRGAVVVMPGHEHDWSRVLIVEVDITEEVRAGRELAASEFRYRELFESSPLAIWQNDWSGIKQRVDAWREAGVGDLRSHLEARPDLAAELVRAMRIVDLNPAAVALYRIPDRAALLREEADVPFSQDEVRSLIEMVIGFAEGRNLVSHEGAGLAFDGSTIDIRITGSLQDDRRADWSGVVIIVEDIGEQRLVMARIRSSEQRYRELFEQSPLAIWEGDWSRVKREVERLHAIGIDDIGAYLRDHLDEAETLENAVRVTDVNNAAVALYAIPDREALLADELPVPGSEDERYNFIDVVDAFDTGQFLITRDIAEVTFDGRPLTVRNTFHVPQAHRENWDRVVLHADDISLRHEAQARIEESERKYRELFEQSPFAIWESDWSAVRHAIERLRGQGIGDVAAHLRAHPAVASGLNDLIMPTDMNDAALRLFGASSIAEVIAGRERVAPTRDEIDSLIDIASGFLDGERVVVREIVEETFDHRVIVVRATSMIPQASRHDWSRVVSIIEDITEQQEARARMEASERRYRELFDQAPVGIRVDDWSHVRRRAERLFVAEGGRLADHLIENRDELRSICAAMRIVEANEGCLRIYGASGLGGLRDHILNDLSDDMLDELARTLEQLVQGASSVSRGETAEHLDGGGMIFTRGTVLIPDEYRRDWARVIQTVEDVTEIRRTREAMESNERRYRELFDQSPVAIWVEDWSRVRARLDDLGEAAIDRLGADPGLLAAIYDDMQLVDINEMGWRQRHASSREEMITWSRTALPEGETEVCRNLLVGLLRGQRRIVLPDSRQHRLDGTTFVERGVTFVPPEFARDWKRVIHVLEDATAEHEALRSLDESRSMMALAQRMTRHGHFVHDTARNRVTVASDTVGQILGVDVRELIDGTVSILDVVHPDDRSRVSERLDDAARCREPVDIEFRVLRPTGEVRYLHEQSEFMVDEQGARVERRIGAVHDVTEERRTAEELRRARDDAERASRAKTEFLATISHELRTPLNAIIGFSEVILEGMFGPLENPRYSEYVRDINESGRHLLDLINDILDLAKAEAGRLQLNEDIVNLRTVLDQSTKLFRERADRSGITLVASAPRDLPRLRADTRKLRQVLLNLVSNAVKFTPDHGRIEVSAVPRPDGGIDLVVSDTGIGMTKEDMARAFEVFGQVDSALNRRYEGTGLGLPLSRAVMQLHGGELIMESVPGRGTRVIARFPPERSEPERPPLSVVRSEA